MSTKYAYDLIVFRFLNTSYSTLLYMSGLKIF